MLLLVRMFYNCCTLCIRIKMPKSFALFLLLLFLSSNVMSEIKTSYGNNYFDFGEK